VSTADWLPYTLPLRQAWHTSRGVVAARHGRLLHLRSTDGRSGWGDCAPLPEFGIDQARATDFAEECAQLDLIAQRAGLPLDAWLGGNPPAISLAVNGSLGSLPDVNRQAIATAIAAGFQVLKVKIGTRSPADEIKRLQQIAETLPTGCQLRLDANGAWSFADAQVFFSACQDLPIEACEEPLREPSLRALAQLQATVPFAIAIDESLEELGADVFRQPPVRRIVIKPARQGSLLSSMELALRARAAGIETIISSALESSCGLLACAHLAAAVAPETVHGLATSSWFVVDTGLPPTIAAGRLMLPGRAGIGFSWAGQAAIAFALATGQEG
jgi:o-succinylbenzoate synthase